MNLKVVPPGHPLFSEKRQDALSPREVKIIVDELKYYVTR